jgi:hypothetical protein
VDFFEEAVDALFVDTLGSFEDFEVDAQRSYMMQEDLKIFWECACNSILYLQRYEDIERRNNGLGVGACFGNIGGSRRFRLSIQSAAQAGRMFVWAKLGTEFYAAAANQFSPKREILEIKFTHTRG